MKGIFRFGRSIAASLCLAVFGFVMQYCQHFLFPSVEPQNGDFLLSASTLSATESRSPQRSVPDHRAADWNIGVVTSRTNGRPHSDESPACVLSSPQSLADQVKEAAFETRPTKFRFTPVTVSLNRPRGICKTEPPGKASVTIHSSVECSRDAFYADVHELTANAECPDVLIFVHGFNVTLEAATARAAQIAEDMPFHGTTLVFSWNSAGQSTEYWNDERNAERYFWNLSQLLAELRSICPSRSRINILAHSMGNRVTLRALEALCGTMDPTGRRDAIGFARYFRSPMRQRQSSSVRTVAPTEIKSRFPEWGTWHDSQWNSDTAPVANLILAAPDVGVQEFTRAVTNIRHACDRMVLYSSDSDYALKASGKAHSGELRAGDSRADVKIDGLEVVRVSGVSRRDVLGHSFYGSSTKVLNQLNNIVGPKVQLSQDGVGLLR